MSEITPGHVEKLLTHWADEDRRMWDLYDRWQRNQTGGLAGAAVDRSRENGARTMLTKAARARVARRLIVQAMKAKDEKGRVPAWAGGDPARCKETRSGAAPRWVMDPVAEQVDRWIASLWSWDPRAAMCLRAHYRLELSTGEGMRWVVEATEMRCTRIGYLAGIARGRAWVGRCAREYLKKKTA
jgi:hypothetical protein